MSVKPILFNGDMVRAILDGRKTTTRRVVKPHNPLKSSRMGGYYQGNGLWIDTDTNNPDKRGHIKDYSVSCTWWTISEYIKRFAPCQPGDILYVRETWCDRWLPDGFLAGADRYGYKADGEPCYGYWGNDSQCKMGVWIPSIHMPKEAARIWLKITNVRVQRLRRMSHEDMRKEGIHYCECPDGFTWKFSADLNYCYATYSGAFEALWNSAINNVDMNHYGWEANPWVWEIEFERYEKS